MGQASRGHAALSPARRRLFIVVSVLLSLLALACIEILLRLSGFGGYEPIFRELGDTPHGKLIVSEKAGTRDFFFANPARPGFSDEYAFYSPKSANTVRIALLGGSAIKGFPQTRRFAASAFLREMLSDCWPGRTVEVINLGTTAVASFPVREFLKQVLDYDPDLVIVYSGHNEFYGAYGVASSSQAGSTPGMLKLQYHIRELAIMQALSRFLNYLRGDTSPSLMEIMVGQDHVDADSWKREAAAGLLYEHVGSMIEMCHDRDVPVMVCSLPGNERDLAPIGVDRGDGADEKIVSFARESYDSEPAKVIGALEESLKRRPHHARAHFFLSKAYFASEEYELARRHFQQARDFDPMPWRATSALQQGLRRAVQERGAQLCDAEAVFRRQSPGGAIGWELMDDHVHLSLQGQALLARTIVETLTRRTDSLGVSRQRFDALPDWEVYAKRLGDNPYDHYGVAHTLRTLFTIPFMHASNPQALHRFNAIALDLESRMRPAIREIAWQWQREAAQLAVRQPISGRVAGGLLREKRFEEAMGMYAVAMNSVPVYSALNLEYAYYWLAIRKQLYGELDPADLDLAAQAIERGAIVLRRGQSAPGATVDFIESMRRLRGDTARAMTGFSAARGKLDPNAVAVADRALALAYIQSRGLPHPHFPAPISGWRE